jgi:SPOR domain
MLPRMRIAIFGLCMLLGAAPALAGATMEAGPLSPCAPQQSESGVTGDQPAWGIEIASAFSKDEALSEFDQVKQSHSDLLGGYTPIMVETCDLHLGTALRYSARIGMDSRDDADALCAKLRAAGGACIVQKN